MIQQSLRDNYEAVRKTLIQLDCNEIYEESSWIITTNKFNMSFAKLLLLKMTPVAFVILPHRNAFKCACQWFRVRTPSSAQQPSTLTMVSCLSASFKLPWPPTTGSWSPNRATATRGAPTPWSTSAGANHPAVNVGLSKSLPPLWKEGALPRAVSHLRLGGSWTSTRRNVTAMLHKNWNPRHIPHLAHRKGKTGPIGWVTSDGGALLHRNETAALWSCGRRNPRAHWSSSLGTLWAKIWRG